MRQGTNNTNNAASMRIIPAIAALVMGLGTHAQGPVTLSLQDAMDMAQQQNYSVQYGQLEAEKAAARVGELLATGLPQISATGSLNNYLRIPTQVVPNFVEDFPFPIELPPTMEIQLGIPWMLQGTVQLNQLIFDGSYLVGLQAARTLKDKKHLDLVQMQHDARVQAAKAYYGVLAAEEGQRLIGEGIPLLERSESEAKAMLEQGFMESTDVDRIAIQLADARNQQRNLGQQAKVARAYLALVLGLPSGTPIDLSDPLDQLMADPEEKALASRPFAPAQHVEQQVAEAQLRLSGFDVRHKQAAYMPSLNGFINYSQQFSALKFEPGKGPWFPGSLWGITLDVPIFSSGMRAKALKQARLTEEQADVNRTATEQRLLAEHEQQRAALAAAQDSYETAKANLELAQRIFQRTSIKFNEGVSSSFELTQEHANYLSAQQNYIQRIVGLLQARTDMRKALDLF